ncbi:hypothetical protein CBP31_01950 [Oceanisphaera profunda]|uniref:HNH nuclease domain-containing protein n=1 Tax=Oceanisphaera profunda TaxID=1416627 RepID=A0A1Y0D2J4_9GAMM|nr:hypothetical protein [Oceanisphaera profunda]ART81544.1 hypothetical protein CBP31_01950 [Oceanisphaera profunda]
MKKLSHPQVNDLDILGKMKCNKKITSYPFIKNEYEMMANQYSDYANNDGNPWFCTGWKISNYLKNRLERHYIKPYSDLKYIKELRDKGSPNVCPLCGSLKTATLDHFLPQADYPEWIIYSKNLIPACDCNSKRSNNVKGVNDRQRVLHPYYDDCLSSRLVSASFSGDFNEPSVDIVPLHSQYVAEETILFHIDTVIKNLRLFPGWKLNGNQ